MNLISRTTWKTFSQKCVQEGENKKSVVLLNLLEATTMIVSETAWTHDPSEPRNHPSARGPPPIKCQQHNEHKTIE